MSKTKSYIWDTLNESEDDIGFGDDYVDVSDFDDGEDDSDFGQIELNFAAQLLELNKIIADDFQDLPF